MRGFRQKDGQRPTPLRLKVEACLLASLMAAAAISAIRSLL